MGENVLRGQVESFKKGRDRELKNMAHDSLFSRPELISTVYTAEPLNGGAALEGDRLHAHPATDGKTIFLAKGHEVVGKIIGDGALVLLATLNQHGGAGIVSMNVTSVSVLSGFITAVVASRSVQQ